MRRLGFSALAAVTLLVAPPSPAGALNLEEWLPGLTGTPFLSERIEYETNVFQRASDEKSSMISRTTPGFLVEYGRGTLQLAAGYRAEILHYFDLEGLDTINHNFVGQGKLTLAKLQLMLRDDYAQTTTPPGTELTGPIKSSTNTLAPTAEYKLTDRFSLGANYTWTHISFPGSDSSSAANAGAQAQQDQTVQQLDRDEHVTGLTVFWKFRPTADLGLGYQYGTKTFTSATERNVHTHTVTFTVRGDVTSKLASTFRIAVGTSDYNTRQPLDAFRTKWRHDNLAGGTLGLEYAVQPWLRTGLDYTFQSRGSNFRPFNYEDSKIAGRITLQF